MIDKKDLTYKFFYKYFNDDIIDPIWVDENIQKHVFNLVQNNISNFIDSIDKTIDNSHAYTLYCKNIYEQIKTKITNN